MRIFLVTRSRLWKVRKNPLADFVREVGERAQYLIDAKEQRRDETLSDWQRIEIRIRPGIQTLEPELDDARAQ